MIRPSGAFSRGRDALNLGITGCAVTSNALRYLLPQLLTGNSRHYPSLFSRRRFIIIYFGGYRFIVFIASGLKCGHQSTFNSTALA